jgi:RNA polymerase sigma-70 factor (ECF subfamily)
MIVTDEALMRAVREGDLSRLEILFDRYHLMLFGFLSRMTGNRHVAEDLVQEVFLRILKYRATYCDDACFKTWVYRIARNARADYFASREKGMPLSREALQIPDRGSAPEEQVELAGESALLRCALMQLRADRRELIILARYQEMKHEAIAELLGIDSGTVKVRIHRALKELREAFLRLIENPTCNAKTSQRRLLII